MAKKTLVLFVKEIFRGTLRRVLLIFVGLVSFCNMYINRLLPPEYQLDTRMTTHIFIIIFLLLVLGASFEAFHTLRVSKLNDFYKFSPEASEDRIFRIFFKLYKDGDFEKNSCTDRRQRWDEEVLKAMKDYCIESVAMNYVISTGRRLDSPGLIFDDNFDAAVEEIRKLVNRNDFNSQLRSRYQ